jgi:hypothetical protein
MLRSGLVAICGRVVWNLVYKPEYNEGLRHLPCLRLSDSFGDAWGYFVDVRPWSCPAVLVGLNGFGNKRYPGL